MNEPAAPKATATRGADLDPGDPETLSPLGTYEEGMNWNPVEKIVYERRSIRAFKKKPLPAGLIRRILEASRFAPSAGNTQPWRFIVIDSPEIIAEMEEDTLRFCRRLMWALDYTRSPMRRRFLAPFTRLCTRFFPRLLHPVPFAAMMQMAAGELGTFYEAPVLVLLLKDKRGAADTSLGAGIAGQQLVLAAESLGVGSCWIGFVRLLTWSRKWPRYKKLLGIEYPYRLCEAIALGYPRDKHHRHSLREVQLVPWYQGNLTDEPRIERIGE